MVPKKSHSIHLERALAQSTLTMPKCSGPTCWTRGWKVPLGLCRTAEWRARGRRRVWALDMGTTLQREKLGSPILPTGSPDGLFLSKTNMPEDGEGKGAAARFKRVKL